MIEPAPLDHKACDLTTAPRRLLQKLDFYSDSCSFQDSYKMGQSVCATHNDTVPKHKLDTGNFIIHLFFNSVLHPIQDYFRLYETGHSVGGGKSEEPREKPPGTSASRTWLVSHGPSVGLKPAPDSGEMIG